VAANVMRLTDGNKLLQFILIIAVIWTHKKTLKNVHKQCNVVKKTAKTDYILMPRINYVCPRIKIILCRFGFLH